MNRWGEELELAQYFGLRKGSATLARLFRVKGEYKLQIASGQVITQVKERLVEARERWPQAFIKLVALDVEGFIQTCCSNHMHMSYGNHKQALIELAHIIGIQPVVS